jgi:hypothetical protein
MATIKIEPIMKNTIKVLFVLFILIGCVAPYQEPVLGGASGDTRFHEPKANIREKINEFSKGN